MRVKVEKPATDTVIARVVRLVEEATEAKAPSERFIDEFSRYYMPAICGLALAVVLVPPLFFGGAWDTWIYRGLTLLLIGCPCALVISTPAAIASSLAAGARRGLLVKGGAVIEQIGKVKHIVFDKTGTLTEGKPKVTDVQPFGSATEHEILTAAGAVEANSSHPLAVSIMAHAKENGISITAAEDSEAMAGKGVRGKVNGREIMVGAAGRLDLDKAIVIASAALEGHGKSVSVVLADGKPIGLIALRDEPRADAKEQLAVIKALGLVPIMLTGDNKANGEAIAAALGIEARTELLPEDKLKMVKALAGQGGVAVVGGRHQRRARPCRRDRRHRDGIGHRRGFGGWRCGDPQQPDRRRGGARHSVPAHDGGHPAKRDDRPRPEGGLPGHHRSRPHRPLDRRAGRHRRHGYRHGKCAASAWVVQATHR